MEWIVFDYAGVISLSPPDRAGALLPDTAGVPAERFWPAYWAHRLPYDLGEVTAGDFWRQVCGRLGAPVDDGLIEVLVELDVRAWAHVNGDTLDLLEELAEAGTPLALLSNAPVELARMVDGRPWARLFRHRLFSADLRLAKPDPEIFGRLTDRLGARPDQVLFVDDRAENVRAAEAAGIRSVLFTDAAGLRADLRRLR
ncbi:HAD family hydrolase [Actinomadura livida]|uniref:HAD family phosphatase n=1 Tax=Actinomadura livida TaxID=79909 RepID=A0A7W7IIZ7_9ACTN|nr:MULTISPECIES: HAD family phosphatase [Actinomadura]MBB4777999.1 putative hydrolase of the HAD superfamily [Actinomadura catellatispora]GGT97323.1 haloacid dehalogenase [Actinomadura livida]